MMKNFIRTFAGLLLAILLILGFFLLVFPKAGDRFLADKKVSTLSAKNLTYAALGDSLTEGVGMLLDKVVLFHFLPKRLKILLAALSVVKISERLEIQVLKSIIA